MRRSPPHDVNTAVSRETARGRPTEFPLPPHSQHRAIFLPLSVPCHVTQRCSTHSRFSTSCIGRRSVSSSSPHHLGPVSHGKRITRSSSPTPVLQGFIGKENDSVDMFHVKPFRLRHRRHTIPLNGRVQQGHVNENTVTPAPRKLQTGQSLFQATPQEPGEDSASARSFRITSCSGRDVLLLAGVFSGVRMLPCVRMGGRHHLYDVAHPCFMR